MLRLYEKIRDAGAATLGEYLHGRRAAVIYRGIRRLRVIKPLAVIAIRDRNGRAYKGYKGDSNYHYDVWQLKDGKWTAEIVSMFDAHQPGWFSKIRKENPTARKMMSLHQNDTLAIEPDSTGRKLVRVVKFGQSGQITLAEVIFERINIV